MYMSHPSKKYDCLYHFWLVKNIMLKEKAISSTIVVIMFYLSLHTASPSFKYHVQLRCQCEIKRKIVEDKKVQ